MMLVSLILLMLVAGLISLAIGDRLPTFTRWTCVAANVVGLAMTIQLSAAPGVASN